MPAFLYLARSDDAGQALADYDKVVDTLKTNRPDGFRWHSQPYPDETHGSIAMLAILTHCVRSTEAIACIMTWPGKACPRALRAAERALSLAKEQDNSNMQRFESQVKKIRKRMEQTHGLH